MGEVQQKRKEERIDGPRCFDGVLTASIIIGVLEHVDQQRGQRAQVLVVRAVDQVAAVGARVDDFVGLVDLQGPLAQHLRGDARGDHLQVDVLVVRLAEVNLHEAVLGLEGQRKGPRDQQVHVVSEAQDGVTAP